MGQMKFVEAGPCCVCQEPLMLTERTVEVLRCSGATFYCPFGHGLVLPRGKSDLDLAREEVERERRERQRAEQKITELTDEAATAKREAAGAIEIARAERYRANGYKGFAARIAGRAKAGVCPCCNRSFVELARHMASKHPEFTPLEIAQGAPPLDLLPAPERSPRHA